MRNGGETRRRILIDSEELIFDIGATSVTGIRASAAPEAAARSGRVAHPMFGTLPLTVADCRSFGSDCARTGLVFEPPHYHNDEFVDAFGISWLSGENAPAPFKHPLQDATKIEIVRYRRPLWPSRIQLATPRGDARFVIADAPCPGMLDLCFGLRNAWHFIDDIASNSAAVSALLDWSLEAIVAGYQRLLTSLPEAPDIVLYGDDFGFRSGMFISVLEFRRLFKPRLHILFEALRGLAPGTAICFHSCGAIQPLLPEIVDLGVDIVNLDSRARDMSVDALREQLPGRIVMHGCTDLIALGQAVAAGNLASIALLTSDFANAAPAIAAPLDAIADPNALVSARIAVAYLRALEPEGLATIARLGPVRDLIQIAMRSAIDLPGISLGDERPTLVDLPHSLRKPRTRRHNDDFASTRRAKTQPI